MLFCVPNGTPENTAIADSEVIPIPPSTPTLTSHFSASPFAYNQVPLVGDQMDDYNNEDDQTDDTNNENDEDKEDKEDEENEEDDDSMRSDEELEVAAIHSHRIRMAEYEFLVEFTDGNERERIAFRDLACYEEDILEYLRHHLE
ncbi:hypothetical protein BV898_14240 [Hypsibius exemplaris]|uniref:Chromo domain-containing protein n=1 Tax=Hypsibius exemplaris TaxID=2072580 RepID=A0A1W0W8A9_HYPEX|nr:hypothetical protein BV898_14240 [Hypsibius exemplaris]